jgi:hypothetical protein
MPHDQEHPMEHTLRAWAATRRQQAGRPFALHPADRARLQADIARVFGPDARAASATALPWRRFLPRLAFALGAGVLLLLAIQQWAPTRDDASMDLARQEAPAAPEPVLSPLAERFGQDATADLALLSAPLEPGPPVLAEPSPRLRAAPDSGGALMLQHYGLDPLAPGDAASVRSAPARQAPDPSAAGDRVPAPADSRVTMPLPEARAMRQPAPRPYAVPAQTSPPTAPPDGAVAEPESAVATSLAPMIDATTAAAPALAPAPADVPTAASAATAEQSPDWAGDFTRPQAPRRNLNAPPDYVLRSFRVEQRGTALRLLDEDGSVYDGAILPGPPAPTLAVTSFADELPLPGSAGFRVTGTNLSARAGLVFQGVLVTGATVRIQGHAILGGRDRIVVDAPGTTD